MTPDLPSMSTHPLHKGNSPRTHARHRSDITPDVRRLMKNEEGFVFQESVSRNLDSVIEGNENNQESGKVGGAQNKGMTEPTKVSEPLIPSIDIEVNVTINIDSGQMALLSEDTRLLFVCLFVYLFISLFVCLFVCLVLMTKDL